MESQEHLQYQDCLYTLCERKPCFFCLFTVRPVNNLNSSSNSLIVFVDCLWPLWKTNISTSNKMWEVFVLSILFIGIRELKASAISMLMDQNFITITKILGERITLATTSDADIRRRQGATSFPFCWSESVFLFILTCGALLFSLYYFILLFLVPYRLYGKSCSLVSLYKGMDWINLEWSSD